MRGFRKLLVMALSLAMLISGISINGSYKVKADALVNDLVKIEGFQVSTGTPFAGVRTISSVESVIEGKQVVEWGNIYGNPKGNITEDDLVIGSDNYYIASYAGTEKGVYTGYNGSSKTAIYYVRTMKDSVTNATTLSNKYLVRAYAKLSDGTYVYSKVSSYSAYGIAKFIYTNSMMPTITKHNYLYDNILKVVDNTFAETEYKYSGLVEAETTKAPETTTKAPETTTKVPETTKTPETTKVPETTTAFERPTEQLIVNASLDTVVAGLDVGSCSTNCQNTTEVPEKLFDGNVNTKLYSLAYSPVTISWKMDRAVEISSYTLTTANDAASYSYRNPGSWALFASNDGTVWRQIDNVSNGGMEAVNCKSYTYTPDSKGAYQYYLIQFSAQSGYAEVQLSEIKINGTEISRDNYSGLALMGDFFSGVNTSATTTDGYNKEVPANVFDQDTSTKLFVDEACPVTLAWDMKKDTTVYKYSLTTANDNETFKNRNPRSWNLYGSKDGNNWELIDQVTDSKFENVNYKEYTFNVDKVATYTHYKIQFTSTMGANIQISEIEMYGNAISDSPYDLALKGSWDNVTATGYVDNLISLFQGTYARLYKRWGKGTEPKTITFEADDAYDGVAYSQGTRVVVSTAYANSHPNDIGFFSHEITHSIQQYGGKCYYGDGAWWVENMANYGGFRYFHWSNPRYVQVYEATDTSLQDWGYQAYGNNKWFFAYMDSRYPSRRDTNGNITYGLIDSINNLIKSNTGSEVLDDPYDTTTSFNQTVKKITGLACIEDLRLQFVNELKAGTWTFTGFADYEDNWETEDIDGLPNPDYPIVGEKQHGTVTNPVLSSAVTSGTNICSGATIFDYSGFTNDNEKPEFLIDGNLATKWCATSSNIMNPTCLLSQVKHWVMIDLKEQKTFNTYTLYNTQSKEGYANATEWEILVSNDAKTWKTVDYQGNCNQAISSVNIGSQTARYVFIKVFTPDNGSGTLRLYEFNLYNK